MQYTEQVKRALKYAKQTAKQCGQSYIGSEHVLMGLMREENGMASAILKECKVDAQKLMELIQELIVPEGMLAERGIMDYSPRYHLQAVVRTEALPPPGAMTLQFQE